MLPKNELQTLAGALKTQPEYTDAVRLRRRIMESPMGRMMQSFEREHLRVMNLGLPEKDAADRIGKLYTQYQSFMQQPMVKEYIKATQNYQKLISESIQYLNGLLDMGGASRY